MNDALIIQDEPWVQVFNDAVATPPNDIPDIPEFVHPEPVQPDTANAANFDPMEGPSSRRWTTGLSSQYATRSDSSHVGTGNAKKVTMMPTS